MKITVKTDPETLFLLHKMINSECQMIADNIGRKSKKSLRLELFAIFTQRCFSYSQNANGKKLSITLKYHLAAVLYEVLVDARIWAGIYESNKIEMFKNELHQKLL